MRKNLLAISCRQLNRSIHGSFPGSRERVAGTLASGISAIEVHGRLHHLLRSSSRSWPGTLHGHRRFSHGSFLPPGLSTTMMARGAHFPIFSKILQRRSFELLKVSFQRRRFNAQRLFSLQQQFWGSFLPTPDTVVLSLIGANALVFFLWRIADPSFMRDHFTISLENVKSGRLHTLITGAFSHSDIGHLAANMFGLYFFGTNIGRLFGPEFLLKLYLAGALGGSIFFLMHKVLTVESLKGMDRWIQPVTYGMGASAAVNAIILLDVFLFPKNIYYVNLVIPVPAMLMGVLIIGHDLWRIQKGDQTISGAAHLGGAVVAALAWVIVKKGWF